MVNLVESTVVTAKSDVEHSPEIHTLLRWIPICLRLDREGILPMRLPPRGSLNFLCNMTRWYPAPRCRSKVALPQLSILMFTNNFLGSSPPPSLSHIDHQIQLAKQLIIMAIRDSQLRNNPAFALILHPSFQITKRI